MQTYKITMLIRTDIDASQLLDLSIEQGEHLAEAIDSHDCRCVIDDQCTEVEDITQKLADFPDSWEIRPPDTGEIPVFPIVFD